MQEEGPPRRAEVLAEIARTDGPAWAGVYRTTMQWPVELTIAPEAGFTLYRHSWCGNDPNWVAIGDVAGVTGSTVRLDIELFEKENTSPSWSCLDDTLHLVRWGDLSFAVAEKSMEVFCAAASDGYTFPFVPFRYLGEREDFDYVHPERPTENPRVPPEFEYLLVKEPISGRVVEIVDWRRRPQLDINEREAYDALYQVDVGASDGLAVGMRLFIDGELRSGRVEHVEPESALFQWSAYDEREHVAGLVGRTATTRHPKATGR